MVYNTKTAIQSKILIVDPIHESAITELRKKYCVTVKIHPTHQQLKSLCIDTEVIILRSGVQLDHSVLESARSLKAIIRAGNGLDNIDTDFAELNNITVVNIPNASIVSVAEHTFALIMTLCRKVALANSQLKQNIWNKPYLSGIELNGKTIGIIGLGKIGLQVARIAKGFNMKVIASVNNHSKQRADIYSQNNIELVSTDKLIKTANIITLHIPLNKHTSMMISDSELFNMKPSSYLINMARGGIVDEQALYKFLSEKRIAGAASDVFLKERTHHQLFELDNFVATPHIGAMTNDVQRHIGREVVKYVCKFTSMEKQYA